MHEYCKEKIARCTLCDQLSKMKPMIDSIRLNNVQARAHEKKGSPVLKEAKALVRTDQP